MRKTKEQNTKYKTLKTNQGITIISLIITIIVMIILASVTITVVVNTGLFGHASNAKKQTEIVNEEEIIKLAAIQILQNDKIDKENMLEKLENKFGKGNVETYNSGDGSVVIKIIDKNRVYETDSKGNVTQESMDIFNIDDTPGALDGQGTETDPWIIMSIEDLVEMSTGSIGFSNKYVKLGKNLDFESELSYANYETNAYNEFLEITDEDGLVRDDIGLMEALTNEKYNGFKTIPFTGHNVLTFDGDNKVIKNIYMKGEGTLGFLRTGSNGTVKNLEITGKIISTGSNVGGISAQYGTIENCISRVDITSTGNDVGGIVGYSGTVINCKNYGKITGVDHVGGISGRLATVYNSENYERIKASCSGGRNYRGRTLSNNRWLLKFC